MRLVELGAGSADKTRLLLSAAVERQDTVFYEPVDVSASALVEAQMRIEDEIPGVLVCPRVVDYTHDLELDPTLPTRAPAGALYRIEHRQLRAAANP